MVSSENGTGKDDTGKSGTAKMAQVIMAQIPKQAKMAHFQY